MDSSIRRMGGVAAAMVCAGCVVFSVPTRAEDAKPNVLMLMTDDLDMSVWETALALGYLPHIKAEMVDKGTTFTNTFAALATCCPSRTTFLTGQYPHNHGVYRNSGKHGGFEAFVNDQSTVATWMKAAGYRTGLIGKYLNEYGTTEKDQGGAYIPPGWDTWKAIYKVSQFDYRFSNQGVTESRGHADADYQTDVIRDFALEFLRDTDRRPFFLTLTPTAPHYESTDEDGGGVIRPAPRHADTPDLPTIPPESLNSFNEVDMGDKPVYMRSSALADPVAQRQGFNSRLAAMRAVDDLFGAVVDQLRRDGREARTALVFTSDNGFQYGTHRRVGKSDLYEEAIHLPMIIRSPGQASPRVVGGWVMNTDWAPTIAALAAAVPDISTDGRSLIPKVSGAGVDGRRTVLVERPNDGALVPLYPAFAMVRSKDPALTRDVSGSVTLVYAQIYDTNGQLTDEEFYDLSIDPGQTHSLHASIKPYRRAQMKALAARLDALRSCAGLSCRALEN
jgi:N-acetylglucosamine-6-sulfatase